MSHDEYADEAAYQDQMAAYANEVEAQLEDEQKKLIADVTEQYGERGEVREGRMKVVYDERIPPGSYIVGAFDLDSHLHDLDDD